MRLAPNEVRPNLDAVPPLPVGRWHGPNHKHLCAWLDAQKRRPGIKLATFDWDNTCIFNDIGDAVWRHQLAQLRVRLDPDTLRQRLPGVVNGVHTLYNGVSMQALADDIMAAYQVLWPHIQQEAVHTVLQSEAHCDFKAKLMHLVTALERTPGVGALFSYPFQARFLDGLSDADIAALTADAWHSTASEAVGTASWQSATPGNAGHVQQSFLTYIAVFTEIMDLMAALRDAGVDVYVVTASCESIVRALVQTLAFPVEPERVLGLRPNSDPATYPVTYRAGKVRVIQEHLPTAPILVAGDANTDFEMLTSFAATEIRLVINRNLHGDIRTLYTLPQQPTAHVTTLLQGRDDNRACFIADHRTIPWGHHTPAEI